MRLHVKKQLKKAVFLLPLLMVIISIIGDLPACPLNIISNLSAAAGEPGDGFSEIPEPFSLQQSETGSEHQSGQWSYAIRNDDGWAVITAYHGEVADEITIPDEIDGVSVVGLSSHALDDFSGNVHMPGNILFIDEDCFGTGRPTISAFNGTLPLYYAHMHGYDYIIESTGDYILVPGVIDYTEAPFGTVSRIGEDYVSFAKLEGMRLSEGDIFWMKDAHELSWFFRVTALENDGDRILASVERSDISETIIEAHMTETYTFTEDDFIPAEGVQLLGSSVNEKARESTARQKSISVTAPISGSSGYKKASSNWKSSVSGSASIFISESVQYTFDIVDGKFTYMVMEETRSHTGMVTIGDSTSKKNH